MALLRTVGYDNGMQRQSLPGDLLAQGELILASNTTNAITVTAAMLLAGAMLRAPTGAATDTIDSAANIIAAIGNGNPVPNGTTWRFRWIVTTAFATTVQATANTGVTVNRGSISASSAKEFLVTVVNGTPAQTLACTTTNGSATIGGLTPAQAALLTPGMVVTNAQAGLQGQTILGVNVSAGTLTMSGNANATNATPVSFNFSPVVQLDGLQQGGI